MPRFYRNKFTSLLVALLLAAAPAFGRSTVRCADGSPCPQPAGASPASLPHECCSVPAEAFTGHRVGVPVATSNCITEWLPQAALRFERQQDRSSIHSIDLPPSAPATVIPYDRLPGATASIPEASLRKLDPTKQTHSPRAPPHAPAPANFAAT
jgi:hypothetical protein